MKYDSSVALHWNYYGLVVRGTPVFDEVWNDWTSGYYFFIDQGYDVDTSDYESCYEVFKLSPDYWTYVTGACYWADSSPINFDDWNTVKVYAKGTSMKFYINDYLMWSSTVSGPTSGRIGVFTWTEGTQPETTYVDWAVAGMAVLPTAAEQVAPAGQIPYHPKPGVHCQK